MCGRSARRVTVRRPAVAADRARGRRDPRPRVDSGRRIVAAVAPTPIILDCDPGHDDAIALLLALASPELELLGVTTTYGNQTLEKTTENALRVLSLVSRDDVVVAAGADRPLVRPLTVAAHVHGESGLDGPVAPGATRAVPTRVTRSSSWPRRSRRRATPVTLVPTGPLTNVARYLEAHGTAGVARDRLDGRGDRRGQHDPCRRVQHLGRSRGRAAGLPQRACR